MADELGKELDRLYELPPGEFTAGRDEAAKRLRGEGKRELADDVKRLRKPTLPIWLANTRATTSAMGSGSRLSGPSRLTRDEWSACSSRCCLRSSG